MLDLLGENNLEMTQILLGVIWKLKLSTDLLVYLNLNLVLVLLNEVSKIWSLRLEGEGDINIVRLFPTD